MVTKTLSLIFSLILFGYTSVSFADTEAAEQVVRVNAQKVLNILDEKKAIIESDPAELYRLVDEVILPNIDFKAMSKLVLAKHWRKATPEQQERFMNEFKGMLVRTYTKSLVKYAGNTEILYLKSVSKKEGRFVTVYTEIQQSGKTNVPVNYSLRRTGGSYLIYDVVIEGLSLVKNYRTSFGQQISETSIDALIDDLARKNSSGETDA